MEFNSAFKGLITRTFSLQKKLEVEND